MWLYDKFLENLGIIVSEKWKQIKNWLFGGSDSTGAAGGAKQLMSLKESLGNKIRDILEGLKQP